MTSFEVKTENQPTGVLSPDEYVSRHKQAFRLAFDFLNKNFPPSDDPDWWGAAAVEMVDFIHQGDDNVLAKNLMFAVYDYLEDECKIRRKINGTIKD